MTLYYNLLYIVNAYEADIAYDMFTRYKNGEKTKEIIDRLNAQGIKTKAGSSFNMNSLARIIRNEKYIGKVTSHGTVYTMTKSYTEREVVVNGMPDLSMIPSNVMDMLVAVLEKEITRIMEEGKAE